MDNSQQQQQQLGDDSKKKPNTLAIWGNAMTMNLNPLILTNIQTSPYFKGPLTELKTYHEVVDEIYYKVKHLEPWEKGSRRTSGQTGMCGGVRGVGAGGIISTAFCLLYKLFTMRLTRKQVMGLANHTDSPYIRALGFMYIRFTQPPADLWDWFEPYIDDPEEVDVRAGGGQVMVLKIIPTCYPTKKTIGEMTRLFLTKLDWFGSLFPRIPVPIQINIDKKLAALKHSTSVEPTPRKPEQEVETHVDAPPSRDRSRADTHDSYRESRSSSTSKSSSYRYHSSRSRSKSPVRDRERERYSSRQYSPSRSSSDYRKARRSRSRSPSSRHHRSTHYNSSSSRKHRDRSRDRR